MWCCGNRHCRTLICVYLILNIITKWKTAAFAVKIDAIGSSPPKQWKITRNQYSETNLGFPQIRISNDSMIFLF